MSEQQTPSFRQTFLSPAREHARRVALNDFTCQAHGIAAWHDQISQQPATPQVRTIIEGLPSDRQSQAWRIVERLTNRDRALFGVTTTSGQAIARLQRRLAILAK